LGCKMAFVPTRNRRDRMAGIDFLVAFKLYDFAYWPDSSPAQGA